MKVRQSNPVSIISNKLTPSIIQTTKVCVLSMKEVEIFYT